MVSGLFSHGREIRRRLCFRGLDAARDHALVLDLYAEKTPHWTRQILALTVEQKAVENF